MTNPTHMTNDKGHLVPVDMVKPQHKLEDQLVNDLFSKAAGLNDLLRAFKVQAFADVATFIALVAEQYGVKKGGKRGNLTLNSYDGLTKLTLQVSDSFAFGPELQIAKQLIDEMIKEKSEGVDETIVQLVNHSFAVDKQGQVNRGNILGLRRLDIKEPKWQQAMQAITDSLRTTNTCQYIRLYRRKDTVSPWVAMSLDFAGV